MKNDFSDKKIFLISLGVSILIHLAIFSAPFTLKHDFELRNLKIFVVDIIREVKNSETFTAFNSVKYEDLIANELREKVKSAINFGNNRQIPSVSYSFDREQYDAEFLKILHEKMKIDDYLEREGVSGAYLFQIEIEGSGRVRDIKTLRKDGSEKLESYVKEKLYSITFPPHGEFVLTIKVNMVFQLE